MCVCVSVCLYVCMCVCVSVVGLLVDMKGVVVTSVALGKAHGVLLTNRGHVFTFGPNNKGQCGRDFTTAANQRTARSLRTVVSVLGLRQDHDGCVTLIMLHGLGLSWPPCIADVDIIFLPCGFFFYLSFFFFSLSSFFLFLLFFLA